MCPSTASQRSTIDWRRAETLSERRGRLDTDMAAASPEQGKLDEVLARWRTELSLNADEDYAAWLVRNGMDEHQFRALLAWPTVTGDEETGVPEWYSEFSAAFATCTDAPMMDDVCGENASPTARVMLCIAAPLIRRGIARLQQAIDALNLGDAPPFDPGNVHRLFLDSLGPRLLGRLDRTLTLELHIARMDGRLSGETPAERFASFGELLTNPNVAQSILGDYPVLARQLTDTVGQWTRYCAEFLRHLHADWTAIARCFNAGADPGPLVRVDGGSGDPHRDGRSVQILTFASGLQLVYKPRRLRADEHFHSLLAWMNQSGFSPALRTPALLSRDDYGWIEFIEWKECRTVAELERFYERQGGLLAVLYALEATDMHRENLIASGEDPVIVDLEALFHPRPGSSGARRHARQLGNERMEHTVLRVGLLPQFGANEDGSSRFDGSALAGGGVQRSPTPVLYVEKRGTDEMRFVRGHTQIAASKNRAQLDGQEVDVYGYRDAIIRGFERAYALLLQHRARLTEDDGLIGRFADAEIRAVLRPTQTYMRVLQESGHPSLLSDAADHERLLQRLGTTLLNRPHLAPVLSHEIADLQTGNVPIFTARPGSRDVWTSSGERIAEYFDEPSLHAVRRRIASLDRSDLARQTWFIRAALTTLSHSAHDTRVSVHTALGDDAPRHSTESTHTQLERAAVAIGQRLEQLAIRQDGLVSWIGITLAGERQWVLEPVGVDLFAGTSGIALFLGYLQAVTGAEHHELARTLATNAMAEFDLLEADADRVKWVAGPFAGWSGWMYTLAHLAYLWRDDRLLADAHRIRRRIVENIGHDDALDVIGGAAGLILALASLHRGAESASVRADVARCADHLVDRARVNPLGVAWPTSMPSRAPLVGFSHGAAGIASSLMVASAVTGDERYAELALQGFAYERAAMQHAARMWPDFREFSPGQSEAEPGEMLAWCHGAPGVGISRLLALSHVDAPALLHDLAHTLEATIARGFGHGHSHCLCHGTLGNAELLAMAGHQLDRPDLTSAALAIGTATVRDLQRSGPVCGTPAGLEVPGLMTGIAGIGMGMLRLAAPSRVPSVLTLDTPGMNRSHTVLTTAR